MFTPFAFVKTAPTAGGQTLWTPTNITTLAWWDASNQSSVTLNGSTVSQINDLSGNGYNGTQSDAGSQPSYTNTLNGLKVMTFDGAGDKLLLPSINIPSNYEMSWYIVLQMLGNLNNYTVPVVLWKNATNAIAIVSSIPGPGTWGMYTYTEFQSGYIKLDTNPYFLSTIINNTTSPYISYSTNGNVTNWAGQQPFIGSSVFNQSMLGNDNNGSNFNGYWGEAVIVPQKDNTAARQKMEGYLAWKWGLQANLPSDSPYKNAPPYV
jgi:hypothetical protein